MFVVGKTLRPGLIVLGKAGAYPSVASEIGSGFTRKHWSRQKSFARVKHSSLFASISDKEKKVINYFTQLSMLQNFFLRH